MLRPEDRAVLAGPQHMGAMGQCLPFSHNLSESNLSIPTCWVYLFHACPTNAYPKPTSHSRNTKHMHKPPRPTKSIVACCSSPAQQSPGLRRLQQKHKRSTPLSVAKAQLQLNAKIRNRKACSVLHVKLGRPSLREYPVSAYTGHHRIGLFTSEIPS